MTKIINIKSKEPYDVYCGRAGHGQDGYFGNPHPIGFCKLCNRHHDRTDAIEIFRQEFISRINRDKLFKERLEDLRGKVLGCFCIPDQCHCEIYIDYFQHPDKYLVKEELNNKKYKLAVVGSRGITQATPIFKFLDDRIDKIEMIVSGGCKKSPDEVAHNWCIASGVPILIFYPDWKGKGKRAGFDRNRKIIESADKVVAFHDGQSKGTLNSIEIAKELNKPCKVIIMSQTNMEIPKICPQEDVEHYS